jgi:hypothetical protein
MPTIQMVFCQKSKSYMVQWFLNVTSYNITLTQNVKFGYCLQAMNNFNQSMIFPFKHDVYCQTMPKCLHKCGI